MATATFVVLFFMDRDTLIGSLFLGAPEIHIEGDYYTPEYKVEDAHKKFAGRRDCLDHLFQYQCPVMRKTDLGIELYRDMVPGDLGIFEDGDVWILREQGCWKRREDLKNWGRAMLRKMNCGTCKEMLALEMTTLSSRKRGFCLVCDTEYELMEKETED